MMTAGHALAYSFLSTQRRSAWAFVSVIIDRSCQYQAPPKRLRRLRQRPRRSRINQHSGVSARMFGCPPPRNVTGRKWRAG